MQASEAPVNLRRLDDLRRRLKEVIHKQSSLKSKSMEAQEEMKRLLAAFMERLSAAAATSDAHHRQMKPARGVSKRRTVADIAPVIQDALSATRWMSSEAARNRDELSAMQMKAEEAAAEVARRKALDLASASARHDLLTGALNRKGLEEALEREVAQAMQQGAALSIAFWTSTTSRPSTTRTATRRATMPSRTWRRWRASRCGRRTRWPASAARSSWCSCRTRAWKTA